MSRVTHLLIHTCTVVRNDPINVGQGKWRENYQPLYEGARCRISGSGMTERTTAQQLKTYEGFAGYFEPGLDIKRDDYIVDVVREDGSVDPRSYRVTGNVTPSIAHHTKVNLEVIEKGKGA